MMTTDYYVRAPPAMLRHYVSNSL